MPLPERSDPDTATAGESPRVLYDLTSASANADPYLEFLPEDPGEPVVKQRVFVIEPLPEEPPRHQDQPRLQDQPIGPARNVSGGVGIRFLRIFHPRTVLLALYRAVTWPFLVLYRAVVRTLVTVYRVVTWPFLTLYRGVVGAILLLRRIVVGTWLAVHRGIAATLVAVRRGVLGTISVLRRTTVGTLSAVHRGVAQIFSALYRGVAGTFLVLRGVAAGAFSMLHRAVMGTLLALRHGVERTVGALRRGVVLTSVAVGRTASVSARWIRSSGVGLIDRTIAMRVSGVSWLSHVGGVAAVRGHAFSTLCGVAAMRVRARLTRDSRMLWGMMSMAGRHASVMVRSLHERGLGSLRLLGRRARRTAHARQSLRMHMPSRQSLGMHIPSSQSLRMRLPLLSVKTPGRVQGMNVTLVAFTGGTALGALAMWFFGVQAPIPGLTDRNAAAASDVVALEPFTDAYVATAGIMPIAQQETVTSPPPVPAPAAVTLPAMTVTSTPAGARVTVDGIGWGETPVTIRHLPPGQKVVRVTKEGYVSQQQTVSVPGDRRSAAVRITLRARN